MKPWDQVVVIDSEHEHAGKAGVVVKVEGIYATVKLDEVEAEQVFSETALKKLN